MEPKTKQYLTVTVVGVTLFVALLNYSAVLAFAGKIMNLILPVIVGCILALFISVPMKGIERRLECLFRKAKKTPVGQMDYHCQFYPDSDLHCFSAGIGFNPADSGADPVISEFICTN